MELVYEYLDADIAEWLRNNNPKPQKGQNHHQWLSGQYGLKKLTEHIWMLIGLARGCQTMRELQTKMAEVNGRQPIQYTIFSPPPNRIQKKLHRRITQKTLSSHQNNAQMQLDLQ